MKNLLIRLDILIPLVLVVIILIVVFWIIYKKNKTMFKKISEEKQRFSEYEKSIYELQRSPLNNPRGDFKKLNKLTRGFFKQYLNLPLSKTYLELEKNFKKEKKQDYAEFCRKMSDADYKGNKSDSKYVKDLINSFAKIVQSY